MPDQIIRDIPLIQRYSRHNENEDLRFRTYVKTRLNMSDKDLDAIVAAETERVWAQIDCLTCGNCCKTLQIVVDDKDIKRLATRIGISVREFSKRYVGADLQTQVKFLINTPCSFLNADNKCSVYEDRPQACRDFPYLHTPKFRSRSIMMLTNLGTCPIVFNVWQALKKRVGLRGKRQL